MTEKRDDYKNAPNTLRKAILAMQKKLIAHEDEYISAPLSVNVEMGDGRIVERANPIVQEYRALVRDYASAIKSYKDITNREEDVEVDQLSDLRSRFKVIR